MKIINKIRLFLHHIAVGVTTFGLYLLMKTINDYPALLDVNSTKIGVGIYLSLYPILIGLVITEDIILLRQNPSWRL